MARRAVVLATRNPHKLREFARLLGPAGIAVEPLPEEIELPPEDGQTFAENALPKARAAAEAAGRMAIADDSGIEAEALGGAPGVRSARYAGFGASDQENLERLVREAPAGSALRYVCVLAYVDPATGEERLFEGESRGQMAAGPRGSGGFGYDPVYLGDTARFPYGDRTQEELKAFAVEIADHLLEQGAKLLVVACNSASAAAIDALEEHLRGVVDVIGVLKPAAQLAVVASHTGRIGLLATPATVASGAYERAVTDADPHVHLESVACPDLAPIIQGGFPFDEQVVEIVRGYCAPLKEADVDTVILGSTHYPLCAPILQRMLGPRVSLISAGAGVARSAERALAARDQLNARADEGNYRFQCTADVESFKALGTRFLQMPLGEVIHVELPSQVPA